MVDTLHQHSADINSASSAIDLTHTPTGLATSSRPPSPIPPTLTPDPNGGEGRARRRASWGRVDAGNDPLFRLDLHATSMDNGINNAGMRSKLNQDRHGHIPPALVLDDPLFSPVDDAPSRPPLPQRGGGGIGYSYSSSAGGGGTYRTAQPGQSSASLMSRDSETEGSRDDDEARLTSNMGSAGSNGAGWPDTDAERTGGLTPRKRTVRYTPSPSPLRTTSSAFRNVSRSIRRVSLRVVNLAGAGLEDSNGDLVRLPDYDDEGYGVGKGEDDGDGEGSEEGGRGPIRGRTLGCFGARSRVRLSLFHFLVHPWTEPTILVLIVINAVVLTIQASPTLTLASSNASPQVVNGYFHTWEDYALFVLFVFFTLEAFARICVSGFLLDPEVPTSSLFVWPFSMTDSPAPAATATSASSSSNMTMNISMNGSASVSRQASLARGLTVRQKLRQVQRNVLRPFQLAHNSAGSPYMLDASSTVASTTTSTTTLTPNSRGPNTTNTNQAPHTVLEKTKSKINHLRNSSQPTFFTKALRSDTHTSSSTSNTDTISLPFRLNVAGVHDKTRRNVPYLRHSWSRIDFVAIVSFWVCFVLASLGVERRAGGHIGLFRAMSVLRTARLLAISSGTTTIMRSLKTARPLLTSVAYFVLFAMILFSIIGIQSFKGSLRRSCFVSPTLGETELQLDQFCGGYIDPTTLDDTSYIQLDGSPAGVTKGYICPLGQVCRETDNPNGNVESFDTIYYAALQVIIVASANGWSPLMYSMIDAEFFVSCCFFIVCIVVLNFWLINLFVAVITNTFSAIRSDTKKSAFGAAPLGPMVDERDEGWAVDGRHVSKINSLKVIYQYTQWCWVFLALASLVVQATRTVDISELHQTILDKGELAITVLFDIEIVMRILAELPDWRGFFNHGHNWLDLMLAIGSSIIQIPAIHRSEVYPWLTIFQLARFYRVILEVPRMKPLMLAVFGNMYGLVNMSLFLLLVNFIAALVAIQLLRGDVQGSSTINFGQLFNAFLGIYQVFSSENWTDVLYETTLAEIPLGQAIILAIFISSWLLFANFIVLQMFIAVINENFNVAEESKKGQQATDYWATTHAPYKGHVSWIRQLNPYRWVKAAPVSVRVDNLPSNLVLPMQKALVQDYNMTGQDGRPAASNIGARRGPRHYPSKSLTLLQQLFAGDTRTNDVPLTNLRQARRDSAVPQDPNDEETERHLEILAQLNTEAATAEDVNDALYERRAQKADFIRDHPTFDRTFWIFSQKNPFRRMCQKLVQPSGGERIFGTQHSPIAHPIFQLALLLAVIGGIVVESIATPIYRRNFYLQHGLVRFAWFDIAEAAFGLTLVVEFVIKVVADGFVFTPNAYVRSIWNVLDLFILAGLIVNLTTSLIFIGGLSRFTRALKALRALRLITLIDMMRNTFQSLIISGVIRILDAAVLAILYMIPYAVWGLNIFAGKMNKCNDQTVNGLSDCNNEFDNSFVNDSFGFLVPRVWDNPSPSTTFSFDTFRSALLILFEIVSLEGWIDVMGIATSITGENLQPQTNASQVNAIFFLIYNLLGGVVILTLFVSIIIGNFSSKTGTAFLTQPQREWIDLQKLIKRQRPSKRPSGRPTWPVRAWCFDRAVNKHGWWSRMMTALFIVHIFALMTQTFSTQKVADSVRNDFFLLVTFVYVIDIFVRFFGLGWRSFRANGWNLFDVVVAGGSFVTTLIVRFGSSGFATQQLQKLFLVSIAFKLVQRTNNLNKLFKTAMASLPVIVSLLSLWLILFIFFAILFVEVFGMTKWHTAETRSQNYSTVGSALVMLAFMSTGEGWNQYMHDYAIIYPRCTNSSSATNLESDCGSVGWAFTLFIAWNLLSMYIFVNMFTGVVVENFSYVFQTTGGAKSITREEMRAFKKVWAEFANQKTGFLERNRFVPFFAKLSGIFEARIYPVEYSTPNIVNACKDTHDSDYSWPSKVAEGIDLNKLAKVLNGIDYAAIRRRRNLYSRLYHEASISHQQGRGISFTDMLLMLAHHKLIVDREALVLKDLVVRTETNKLVTDLVNLDRVRSLLKMISHRRRFLAQRKQLHMTWMQHQDIPAIVVDTMPSTPPPTTRDITSARREGTVRTPEYSSPSPMDHYSPDLSLGESNRTSLQRSRRTSDMSMLSTDLGNKNIRDSSLLTDEDHHNVLSSMQNSMWGDMMLEAAGDED